MPNVSQKLMLAFEGYEAPARILELLRRREIGGFTLFRPWNVRDPAQVRALTASLQAAAAVQGHAPLLIAADQEGGQLVALGPESTPFPGNMALGAIGDHDLVRQVGFAQGQELLAMGVNVNYGPVCDVNTNPHNPNVGVRAFGDDPFLVADLAAAMIAGLQAAGVAATAKHFPGNGDSDIDPHYGIPVLSHSHERLELTEFPPFRAAIHAGVRLMMTAHVAMPHLTSDETLPATLSRTIMHDLLREEMGFDGLVISDAFDMAAISQGIGQVVDAIAAIRAGVDLLLLPVDAGVQEHILEALQLAVSRGLIGEIHLQPSVERIAALKCWLAHREQPPLEVVGCANHRRLEQEVAQRSITQVRNRAGLLPLSLPKGAAMLAISPEFKDLTPADTSSFVPPTLARALRAYHPFVDEIITPQPLTGAEIATVRERARAYDLLVVGTIGAYLDPQQAALVHELAITGLPMITVALRTPYDLSAYPQVDTHVCTYSIQPCAMEALAAALWGKIPFRGRLPVKIPGVTVDDA